MLAHDRPLVHGRGALGSPHGHTPSFAANTGPREVTSSAAPREHAPAGGREGEVYRPSYAARALVWVWWTRGAPWFGRCSRGAAQLEARRGERLDYAPTPRFSWASVPEGTGVYITRNTAGLASTPPAQRVSLSVSEFCPLETLEARRLTPKTCKVVTLTGYSPLSVHRHPVVCRLAPSLVSGTHRRPGGGARRVQKYSLCVHGAPSTQ